MSEVVLIAETKMIKFSLDDMYNEDEMLDRLNQFLCMFRRQVRPGKKLWFILHAPSEEQRPLRGWP